MDYQALIDAGYRGYEIYTYNKHGVEYCGEWRVAGEVAGWEIEFVIARPQDLKNYPFFDAKIAYAPLNVCETFFENGQVNLIKR